MWGWLNCAVVRASSRNRSLASVEPMSFGWNQLERHAAPEARVAGHVDFAHAPPAQQPHDLEAADDVSRLELTVVGDEAVLRRDGVVAGRDRRRPRGRTRRPRRVGSRRIALGPVRFGDRQPAQRIARRIIGAAVMRSFPQDAPIADGSEQPLYVRLLSTRSRCARPHRAAPRRAMTGARPRAPC